MAGLSSVSLLTLIGEMIVKVCPRCRSIAFDDMETCYGCLYRFPPNEEETMRAMHGPGSFDTPAAKSLADAAWSKYVASDSEETVLDSVDWPPPEFIEVLPDGTSVAQVASRSGGSIESRPSQVEGSCASAVRRVDLESLADIGGDEIDISEPEASGSRTSGEACQRADQYCLCVESGSGPVARYRFDAAHALVVGRSKSCDVELPDPTVSRRHMRVDVEDGNVVLENLGSSNPTYVDGWPLEGKMAVALGTLITIANARLWTERLQDPRPTEA
jgi:hypothetical protein